MTKRDILRALEDLPDDASIEDAMERLVYLYKIETGHQARGAGRRSSQEEAKASMAQWHS